MITKNNMVTLRKGFYVLDLFILGLMEKTGILGNN